MIDLAIAFRFVDRNAILRIGRQANSIVVGLNLLVAGAVLESLNVMHMWQQSTAGVAWCYVGINVFDKVIFVLLAIVDSRVCVSPAHACHILTVLALRFSTHCVSHSRCGHQIADIGRVDEHLAVIRLAAKHGDRRDSIAVHRHALA